MEITGFEYTRECIQPRNIRNAGKHSVLNTLAGVLNTGIIRNPLKLMVITCFEYTRECIQQISVKRMDINTVHALYTRKGNV